jgi:ABC-type oligopeptide transport system ATPase subunit
LQPKVLILDEPVSALDVSIQAQVLNLLVELQREFRLSMIFISHDLSVVKHISDETLVLYFGEIAEMGPSAQIFTHPQHAYTRKLLESAP